MATFRNTINAPMSMGLGIDAERYREHYEMHEARRQKYDLPPLSEQPCDACERGKPDGSG